MYPDMQAEWVGKEGTGDGGGVILLLPQKEILASYSCIRQKTDRQMDDGWTDRQTAR